MNLQTDNIQRSTAKKRPGMAGVTVIELMVSVTLISFIILALYQMFATTQRQLRRAMKQVDTLESGRAVMGMIQRDLGLLTSPDVVGQIDPSFYWSSNWTANGWWTNSLVGGNPTWGDFVGSGKSTWGLTVTSAVDVNIAFTNQFDRFFVSTYDVSLQLTNWGGVGYHVGQQTNSWYPPVDGMGTLYRYSYNDFAFNRAVWNTFRFSNSISNMARVIDNVVHFKVSPYPANRAGAYLTSGFNTDQSTMPLWSFTNSVVPSLVEVEVGYVDEETAELARQLGDAASTRNFLAARPETMTLFRFLVPVRVDSQ
jgi:hypothetical protein